MVVFVLNEVVIDGGYGDELSNQANHEASPKEKALLPEADHLKMKMD